MTFTAINARNGSRSMRPFPAWQSRAAPVSNSILSPLSLNVMFFHKPPARHYEFIGFNVGRFDIFAQGHVTYVPHVLTVLTLRVMIWQGGLDQIGWPARPFKL